jgi:hypothetical protein
MFFVLSVALVYLSNARPQAEGKCGIKLWRLGANVLNKMPSTWKETATARLKARHVKKPYRGQRMWIVWNNRCSMEIAFQSTSRRRLVILRSDWRNENVHGPLLGALEVTTCVVMLLSQRDEKVLQVRVSQLERAIVALPEIERKCGV